MEQLNGLLAKAEKLTGMPPWAVLGLTGLVVVIVLGIIIGAIRGAIVRRREREEDMAAAAAWVPPEPVAAAPPPPPPPPPAPAPVAAVAPPAPPPPPPPAAAPDDLTQMKGVGPRLAEKLNAVGITTFAQLGGLTDAEAAALDAKLGDFSGRLERDRWREQAQLLALGDTKGFEDKFGKL